MIDIQQINKIQADFEKKLERAEQNYNDLGNSRRTVYKYQDLIELCRLARYQLEESCPNCNSTRNNLKHFIKKYEDKKVTNLTITPQEVIDDLGQLFAYTFVSEYKKGDTSNENN